MVLVGPSGSGKTTALRMLAGLEEVDAGAIKIGGRDVSDEPPKRRDVAMVFQNYALYPYLTVAANIAFPLRMARMPKADREARVRDVAELLELTPYLERKPGQLSGGQRQRVAMGRAILREPQVFLMDEPLSNLDAKLRVQMRADIAELQARLGVTTVYVTHDQAEAMTLGHRVAVLRDARLRAACRTALRQGRRGHGRGDRGARLGRVHLLQLRHGHGRGPACRARPGPARAGARHAGSAAAERRARAARLRRRDGRADWRVARPRPCCATSTSAPCSRPSAPARRSRARRSPAASASPSRRSR